MTRRRWSPQEPWTVDYKQGDESGRTYEPRPPRGPNEAQYGHDLQARCTLVFPTVRMFRRNTGLIKLEDRVFRAGIPGQCDFYALGKGGRHYEIELKREHGRLSEAQRAWKEWCLTWGISWILLQVRKGEVPCETVHRWVEELRGFW